MQRRLFAGCHVSRAVDRVLADGGLPGEDLRRYYAEGEPRLFGSLYEGRTVAAS